MSEPTIVSGETDYYEAPPWWQRVVWWYHRTVGRDVVPWLQWLVDRQAKKGGGVIYVPKGTYQWHLKSPRASSGNDVELG